MKKTSYSYLFFVKFSKSNNIKAASVYHLLITTQLKQKLKELIWFAKEKKVRSESYCYPKGLFRYKNGNNLQSYFDEIHTDIEKISSIETETLAVMLAEKVVQKISVLVNSFRSQHLRGKKVSALHALKIAVDQSDGTVIDYLKNQYKEPSNHDKKHNVTREISELDQVIQQKREQLAVIKDPTQKNQINGSITLLVERQDRLRHSLLE
jgi:primosomal protein N''